MNTAGAPSLDPVLSSHDPYYDSDEGQLKNSPLLAATAHPHYTPSPPPTVLSSKVSSPTSERGRSNRRRKIKQTHGDAVLISLMGDGKDPGLAAAVGSAVLVSDQSGDSQHDDWDDSSTGSGGESPSQAGDGDPKTSRRSATPDKMSADPGPLLALGGAALAREALRATRDHDHASNAMSIDEPSRPDEPSPSDPSSGAQPQPPDARDPPAPAFQSLTTLQTLAAAGLGAAAEMGALSLQEQAPTPENPPARVPANIDIQATRERMQPLGPPQTVATPRDTPLRDDRSATIGAPSPYSSTGFYSPRAQMHSPLHHIDMRSPGPLPPIQPMGSPRSEPNGHNALPSIREQLGDLRSLPDNMSNGHPTPMFPHSPPGGIPRLGGRNHASPPISPNDFRRDIPSPGHMLAAHSPYYLPQSMNGHHPRSTDYNSSTTETPSTEHSTPATSTSTQDRMSIDGITNPQLGLYICKVPDCTAQPFQTQYLLNSHANVHSSARPHYCPVKGCPRSEGGKGFKRKNEMIRHGLVHDSPGYVCPFCPDREHRYPRPDNLQRWVCSRRPCRCAQLTGRQTCPCAPHRQGQRRLGTARRTRAAARRAQPRPQAARPGISPVGVFSTHFRFFLHIFTLGESVSRGGACQLTVVLSGPRTACLGADPAYPARWALKTA